MTHKNEGFPVNNKKSGAGGEEKGEAYMYLISDKSNTKLRTLANGGELIVKRKKK